MCEQLMPQKAILKASGRKRKKKFFEISDNLNSPKYFYNNGKENKIIL